MPMVIIHNSKTVTDCDDKSIREDEEAGESTCEMAVGNEWGNKRGYGRPVCEKRFVTSVVQNFHWLLF